MIKNKFSFFRTIIVCLIINLLISCSNKSHVSLIIHHANIYTVDSGFTKASAIAVDNEKIVAIGNSETILKSYYSEQTIDAKNQTIFPGFIDAHCHFTGFATDSWKCDLVGTASFSEIISRLIPYSKTSPLWWIYGRGWDQNDWVIKQFPDKHLLDSLFPTRPVFLKRIDGHAALANQAALDMAHIKPTTIIDGGTIETKNGKLTGMLIDNAMNLVEANIPSVPDSLAKKYFFELQKKCFEKGLTGVHDCGVSEHTIDLLKQSQEEGWLKMKIFALLIDSAMYYDRWIKKGPLLTKRLHVGGFKLYADGALGSRGACLLQDYADQLHWKGFLLNNVKHFEEVAHKLAKSEFQMCTHAIGDSGNRTILRIYEAVLKGKNDRRWRIEHAQVVDESDLPFFKNNHIIPSVQPTHATSDMYWAEKRLGNIRIKNAYAYQTLLQQNNWMPLGTDFPVEDINPVKTFFAALARKDSNGYPKNGYQKNNALTREQAIRGMTIWAAKSAFEEKEKGSLEKGKFADFIIIDSDLMHCDENEILKTKVLATYINGEKVY